MLSEIFLAQQASGTPEGLGGMAGTFLPLLLMFGVIYFLMIRPQQKQQKLHQAFLASLKKGDEVVTASGIFGRIDLVEDGKVKLEIAPGVKIRVLQAQIASAAGGATAETDAAKKPAETEKK